jgi:hypothetical protein|uniref:Major capsid protein N-terminal domain-containing protein n=1 Tax=viral metagenome TaxID=1070528 RepID=A0A6C0ECB7_9ZZZZ
MGIGLLNLTNVGKENIYLSANPEITFFKIAYKRYTNFSIEETPQYFKSTPDFGRRCTVNISKNADLMGKIYLYVELPSIQFENISKNNDIKFAWVNKIGIALINFVEFELGGSIIDRHYGDWLNIWNELTIGMGLKKSYNKMIGNINELTNFSSTKYNYILYIPLSFWFCLDSGLALPLIALSHNDIKIHVEFNDINSCYKLSPSYYINITNNICILNKGEKIIQTYQNTQNIGEFVYFDKLNQLLYYNPIIGKFIVPTSDNDNNLILTGETSNFKLYIQTNSVVVQGEDYFKFNTPSLINSYLLINYIYLDNYERNKFINKNHEYIVQVIQTLPEQPIYSINYIYKLPLYNPVKLLIWRTLLSSNKLNNNQFNYTSIPYTNTEESLINKNLLVINSVNRMDLDSIKYYTNIQKHQYNFYNDQSGIYMYSFSLSPRDLQPSSSMNFSRIDDAYIQLNMNTIINYQNPVLIQCYAIQYNLFRANNGIGGLVFNL